MKTLSATLLGLFAASMELPAFAGPNWDVIHEAEARHLAHHAEEHVLPLDHGPRAISTPWLNKMQEMHVATTPAPHAHMVAANSLHN